MNIVADLYFILLILGIFINLVHSSKNSYSHDERIGHVTERRYCLEYPSMPEDANRSLPTAKLENSILRCNRVGWNAKLQ